MQRCPAAPNAEVTMSVAAEATSASGKSTKWFLAPPRAMTYRRRLSRDGMEWDEIGWAG